MDPTPIFDALVAEWRTPLRDLMGRHSDRDGDGVADQADPDWLPEPPAPVTPIGPADPDDPAYSRTGDGEPPRWPEPAPGALTVLIRDAAQVDQAWLDVAAQPIDGGQP